MKTDPIPNLVEIVESNLSNENFGPEELAEKFGVSHSTLHRKIKAATGKTISQFIREIRLKKASEILLTESLTISEVAFKVGFGSATYFNKCFHEYFGTSPGEYKKKESEKKPETRHNKWKTQKLLLFIVAPILILAPTFLFLNDKFAIHKNKSANEKSIAVLPVEYLGDSRYKYQADGVGEEIEHKLSNIKDLRVLGRSSVEPYRNSNKTDKQIGKDLKVSTLLRIAVKKENNDIFLYVRLFRARNGAMLFSEKFSTTDEGVLAMQNKIAMAIAKELDAEITQEEKQRIDKIPTINLSAYDFYQKGKEELWIYHFDDSNKKALEKAGNYFQTALEYDPEYALAYTGMAQVYWYKRIWKDFFKETYLDSIRIFTKMALSIDNELAEAYYLNGSYFQSIGNFEQALIEYDKALKYNPNLWEVNFRKGRFYLFDAEDIEQAFSNFFKAAELHRGKFLPDIFKNIGLAFQLIGMHDEAKVYFNESFKLDKDSLTLYYNLGETERLKANYEKAIKWYFKAYQYDSTNVENIKILGFALSHAAQHKKSLKYFQKYYERKDSLEETDINCIHRIGYAYDQNGFTEKADSFFELQIQYCTNIIKLKRLSEKYKYVYYDLGAVYAVKGEKDKALENLRIFNTRETMPYWAVSLIKDDPLYESLWDDPEYQKIVKDIERKFWAEQKRVKKWLEENELL